MSVALVGNVLTGMQNNLFCFVPLRTSLDKLGNNPKVTDREMASLVSQAKTSAEL